MLLRIKRLLCNKYTNSNTDTSKKDNYALLRYFNTSCLLSWNLHINTNNRDILLHILDRKILVIRIYSYKNGSSKVQLIFYILLSRKKEIVKYYRISLNEDYSM